MAYRLGPFADVGLTEEMLGVLLAQHVGEAQPRMERLWKYYRNPVEHGANWAHPQRPRLAQEAGLPRRLTHPGPNDVNADDRASVRREIVIENDIGWRIHAMIDFMLGKPVRLVSTAGDEALRETIDRVLDAVWEASGGIALLQDAALLGHVYGHVDLLVRADRAALLGVARSAGDGFAAEDVLRIAEAVRVEVIEPTRGVAMLNPSDYRTIDAYIVAMSRELNRPRESGGLSRIIARASGRTEQRQTSSYLEIFSASHRQRYEDGRLIESSPNTAAPGRIPIVHIQNMSQPLRYAGLSEVEPLIPLQDELNTRLSDRASRVTMQCFKMYLAKGIDGFEKVPVGPGQIWSTDNPDADVTAFGGDAESPSEESHIEQVREAMDKISGVPPLASGVVRAKVGNLTSANALKITLMGILSKTARKRVSYGRGIAEVSRLILHALDAADVLPTRAVDRGIRVEWPDPLPQDSREQVALARAKHDLGAPLERVLAELGDAPVDQGVM